MNIILGLSMMSIAVFCIGWYMESLKAGLELLKVFAFVILGIAGLMLTCKGLSRFI